LAPASSGSRGGLPAESEDSETNPRRASETARHGFSSPIIINLE